MTIHQQITDFEQQNPKIAEAMKLFDMTMIQYQGAMNALNPLRVYYSTSTVRIDKPSQSE